MLSKFIFGLALYAKFISAQQLPPTEQTSFSYPPNGVGVTVPFPSYIATLTGLTDWPARLDLAPITPNIVKEYNPSSTTILPDIVSPPVARGMDTPSHGSNIRFHSNIRRRSNSSILNSHRLSRDSQSENNILPNRLAGLRQLSPHTTSVFRRPRDRSSHLVTQRLDINVRPTSLCRTRLDNLRHPCCHRTNPKTIPSTLRKHQR